MAYHTETFKKGKRIPLEDVRKIETKILKSYIEFCENHNLRYFLAGGTLVGAVRNQGFIPWDDDIDVVMPRPDYDKFHELTKGKIGKFEVRSIDYCPDIHCRGLIRVVDSDYMTQLQVDPMFLPPWIDVFPLEGLPSDYEECLKHYKKANFWKKLSSCARVDPRLTKIRWKRWLRRICLWPFRHLIGPICINKKLIKIAQEYKFDDCDYVGVVATGLGIRERMPKEFFLDGEKKLPFEGMMVSVPPHYDRYLESFYGDYLRLPNLKSRKIHIIGAWKVKK